MSDNFNKLSAEIKMVKLMCEGLKSFKSIKLIKKQVKSVQSAYKILKCKVCELKFKDKHELKEHWTKTEVFCKSCQDILHWCIRRRWCNLF